jgi:hypothetical protein
MASGGTCCQTGPFQFQVERRHLTCMKNIASVFRTSNLNPPVNENQVSRIERVPIDSANPHLSMLYFYGVDEQGRDKIVRIWFYSSGVFRDQDLASIRLGHPHIPVV